MAGVGSACLAIALLTALYAVFASVRGARVLRVGRIAVRCYIVGLDGGGNVVGLATTAIET